MNFTPNKVNKVLKQNSLELNPSRTDNVNTIKRLEDNKVVAAIHFITRRFWIKDERKKGVNNNFVTLTDEVMSVNDLNYCCQEALKY